MGNDLYETVGVGPQPFTGTEPGTIIDIFVSTMMHPGAVRSDWTWMRTLARVNPGVPIEPLRPRLDATSRAFEEGVALILDIDLKLHGQPSVAGEVLIL
jgi:hypothetical protein